MEVVERKILEVPAHEVADVLRVEHEANTPSGKPEPEVVTP